MHPAQCARTITITCTMLTRLQRLAMIAVDAIKAASTEIGATPDTINANASKLCRAAYIAKEYSEMIRREAEVSGHENQPVTVQVIDIAGKISCNVEAMSQAFSIAFNEEQRLCTAPERVADLRNIASGSKQVRETQLRVAEAAEMVAYCASSLGIEARMAVQLLSIATEAEKVARASGEGLIGIATGSLQRLDTASNVASMAADGVRTASNKVLEYADEYILREYMNRRGNRGLVTKGLVAFIEAVFKSAVINRSTTNASTPDGKDYITNAVEAQTERVSRLRNGTSQDCIDIFAEYASVSSSALETVIRNNHRNDASVPRVMNPSAENDVEGQ